MVTLQDYRAPKVPQKRSSDADGRHHQRLQVVQGIDGEGARRMADHKPLVTQALGLKLLCEQPR
jgi:hypothetical protein